jgi:hypothetical protein
LPQVQQIAEALGRRTTEQRLLMMSKPEGCVMIKFNVSNGNPVRFQASFHSFFSHQHSFPRCLLCYPDFNSYRLHVKFASLQTEKQLNGAKWTGF